MKRNQIPQQKCGHEVIENIIRLLEGSEEKDEVHLLEDLHANWRKEIHTEPLFAFLDGHMIQKETETKDA